ncbi:MAG: UPF0175 family protein [Planctomycetaceae bacterium]|nr:UPF0175 family protein [Planctomycetaceae bacterium]
MMKTITMKVPNDIRLKDWEISMMLASRLYAEGDISAAQGAEMVGVSRQTFVELLGKYGVSYFSESFEDLESDVRNA